MKNDLRRDCLFDDIEREFNRERRLAHKEFEDRNAELTETLISELNERKKTIERDFLNMELCMYYKHFYTVYYFIFNIWVVSALDSPNQKSVMKRKLRRRPINNPVVPATREKRHKRPPPLSNKYFLLQKDEIERDVKLIQDSLSSLPYTSTTTTPTVNTCDTVNYSTIWKPGLLNLQLHFDSM